MWTKPGTSSGSPVRALGLLSILVLIASCQAKSPGPPSPAPVVPPLPTEAPPQPDPSPAILGQASLFSAGPVRGILRSGDLLVASGERALVALDSRLREVWRTEIGTTSPPVLSKGFLYVSGEEELLLVEAETGAIHARGPALGYGAKILPFPGGAVAAGMAELTFIPSGSAKTGQVLAVEGGSLAAILEARDLLVARASGGLALVDPRTGEVKAQAPGPVTPWLQVYGDLAILAGLAPAGSQGGSLAAYRLPSLELLWTRELDFSPQAEPSVDASDIFVWGEGYLAEFSHAGHPGPRIGAVCAPPLLSRGSLYYGLFRGHLIEADPATLKPRALVRLPAALSAKPLAWEGELRLALVDGSVLSLDPSKLKTRKPGDTSY